MVYIVNQALSVFVTNLQISHILLCLKVGMISLKRRCVTGSLSLVCSGAGWRYKIRGRGVQGAGPLHDCTTSIHWGTLYFVAPLECISFSINRGTMPMPSIHCEELSGRGGGCGRAVRGGVLHVNRMSSSHAHQGHHKNHPHPKTNYFCFLYSIKFSWSVVWGVASWCDAVDVVVVMH